MMKGGQKGQNTPDVHKVAERNDVRARRLTLLHSGPAAQECTLLTLATFSSVLFVICPCGWDDSHLSSQNWHSHPTNRFYPSCFTVRKESWGRGDSPVSKRPARGLDFRSSAPTGKLARCGGQPALGIQKLSSASLAS